MMANLMTLCHFMLLLLKSGLFSWSKKKIAKWDSFCETKGVIHYALFKLKKCEDREKKWKPEKENEKEKKN